MKRSSGLAVVLLVACMTAASGCASRADSASARISAVDADALTSTVWLLTSIGGDPIEVPAERSRPTLAFDPKEKRVSGLAAVNRFSGTYSLDGGGANFGPLVATKMAGTEELNDLELRYLRALEQVDGWRIDGGLELLAGGRVLLRFTARQ